mmetsp:Transcript_42183/g.106213  ORF Transcript_42183/g.106213 Transcript_42183/m.106213 type:complete len:216 (+) Transcript_42183:63-710(+)
MSNRHKGQSGFLRRTPKNRSAQPLWTWWKHGNRQAICPFCMLSRQIGQADSASSVNVCKQHMLLINLMAVRWLSFAMSRIIFLRKICIMSSSACSSTSLLPAIALLINASDAGSCSSLTFGVPNISPSSKMESPEFQLQGVTGASVASMFAWCKKPSSIAFTGCALLRALVLNSGGSATASRAVTTDKGIMAPRGPSCSSEQNTFVRARAFGALA